MPTFGSKTEAAEAGLIRNNTRAMLDGMVFFHSRALWHLRSRVILFVAKMAENDLLPGQKVGF